MHWMVKMKTPDFVGQHDFVGLPSTFVHILRHRSQLQGVLTDVKCSRCRWWWVIPSNIAQIFAFSFPILLQTCAPTCDYVLSKVLTSRWFQMLSWNIRDSKCPPWGKKQPSSHSSWLLQHPLMQSMSATGARDSCFEIGHRPSPPTPRMEWDSASRLSPPATIQPKGSWWLHLASLLLSRAEPSLELLTKPCTMLGMECFRLDVVTEIWSLAKPSLAEIMLDMYYWRKPKFGSINLH